MIGPILLTAGAFLAVMLIINRLREDIAKTKGRLDEVANDVEKLKTQLPEPEPPPTPPAEKPEQPEVPSPVETLEKP
jgi:hypothetical protein